VEARTVYSVLEETATAYPKAPAMHQPLGGGKYRTWTWREYRDTVRQVAVGLRALGVRKGDMVAIQSETRAEFYLADLGILAAGAISAALYTSLPYPEQVRTLQACGARWVFVESAREKRQMEAVSGGLMSAGSS
jgi:long-chain acyl-CoA synthetase